MRQQWFWIIKIQTAFEGTMRYKSMYTILVVLAISMPMPIHAKDKVQETLDMIQSVADACESDMETHCSSIEPGQDHFIACLYSHHDQISEQCSTALSGADPRLEQYAAEMAEAVYACFDDFEVFCAGTAVEPGLYLKCLKKHDEQISSTCIEVMKKTGYW